MFGSPWKVDEMPPYCCSAGGSLPVCFSYFSEFQPNEKRGAMISALATFWMAGNVLTAGLLVSSTPHLILMPQRTDLTCLIELAT